MADPTTPDTMCIGCMRRARAKRGGWWCSRCDCWVVRPRGKADQTTPDTLKAQLLAGCKNFDEAKRREQNGHTISTSAWARLAHELYGVIVAALAALSDEQTLVTTPDTRLTQELRRLMDAATPAPWKSSKAQLGLSENLHVNTPALVRWIRELPDGRRATSFVAQCDGHGCQNDADAELIAALRNAAPALLALADESSRLREALEEGIRALEARGMAYASNRLRAALMPPSPEPR